MRLSILESAEEATYSKGSDTTLLCVLLLRFSNEASHVLHWGFIFILETERLALDSGHVDKYSSVGLQASKSKHQVLVNTLNFTNSAWILKFSDTVLFYCQHDTVWTFESNSGRTSVYGLKSVLNLEELTVWRKYSDCFVVLGHWFEI